MKTIAFIKKAFRFAVSIVAGAGAASCGGGNTAELFPNIQFESAAYTLREKPVQLKIIGSSPAGDDLTVGFTLGGDAAAGSYELSADSFVIGKGQTQASITLTPLADYEEPSTLTLTLDDGNGYTIGHNGAADVTLTRLRYVYSFTTGEVYALRSAVLTVTVNDPDFEAPSQIEIPFRTGAGTTAVPDRDYTIADDVAKFVIPEGGGSARITVNIAENPVAGESAILVIEADVAGDSRFVSGEFPSVRVVIRGAVTPDLLAGKWEHAGFIGLSELRKVAAQDGMNTAAVPSENDGYRFEIMDGGNGSWKFVPGGAAGDLSGFFREGYIRNTAPVNSNGGTPAGDYVMLGEEYAWDGEARYDLTYFELERANRSFDPAGESPGKTAIAVQMNDEGTIFLFLRDYDRPPFLSLWWSYDSFNSRQLGFGYVFRKVS